MSSERKEDTRNKIMMGGLIVKSELDYLHNEHKDILLGLLIDAKNKLKSSEAETYLKKWKALGEKEFIKDKKSKK